MFTTKTTVAILRVLAAALVYTDPTNAMLGGRAAASGERDRRAKGATAGTVIASGRLPVQAHIH